LNPEGADSSKVQRPGGEFARRASAAFGDGSPTLVAHNRSKRAICFAPLESRRTANLPPGRAALGGHVLE
jgi:hypothetical protein